MGEENKLLKVTLGILAVLAVLGALWRVMSYQSAPTAHSARVASAARMALDPQEVSQQLQTAKVNELLGEEEPVSPKQAHPPLEVYTPADTAVYAVPKQGETDFVPTTTPPAAVRPMNHATNSPRYVETNFYTPDTKNPSQMPSASYRSSGFVGPQANFNTSAGSVAQERARMLAPYLRPNAQDQAKMNAQWNKLSAALERAIAKALTPKSKQEEMVAKYAPTQGKQTLQTPGFTGALAPVGEQLASQKQLFSQNMKQAFGSAAAQQASSMMDSFAGEVAGALNAPNLTAQQKEQQVKEIAKKYQKKMDKLVEKSQYDKFVAQRTEQINQQKAALQARYEGALGEQLGRTFDEEWQEEQNLATQNLSQEEYNTRLSQLHQSKRNERQQLILKQGQSINPLLDFEKQQEEAYLKQLQEKIQSGEIESVTRKASFNEIQQMQADVRVKSQDTLDRIAKDPFMGPQAAEEFKPILDNYQAQLNQLYQQELSVDERRQQENELLKGVNRQLIGKQMEYVERMNIPQDQKQRIMDELTQAYNNI